MFIKVVFCKIIIKVSLLIKPSYLFVKFVMKSKNVNPCNTIL